jgi:hypothetical protein
MLFVKLQHILRLLFNSSFVYVLINFWDSVILRDPYFPYCVYSFFLVDVVFVQVYLALCTLLD